MANQMHRQTGIIPLPVLWNLKWFDFPKDTKCRCTGQVRRKTGEQACREIVEEGVKTFNEQTSGGISVLDCISWAVSYWEYEMSGLLLRATLSLYNHSEGLVHIADSKTVSFLVGV